MENEMKFPKRAVQHISESASFKLFSSRIPDNWIIRELTEKDYGIDAYLEIVNEKNEVTGNLALIQLKSRQAIEWTKDNYYTLTGINIETTNYWYNFPVPVFLFLADIENEELFCLSVNRYIKKNYSEFLRQETFNYRIEKRESFGKYRFQYYHLQDSYRQQFESELFFFLSNLRHFQEFQEAHYNLDYHLGIEDTDLIFFEAMHKNFEFLCSYLEVKNPVPAIESIKKRSREKFPSGFYDLYEHDLTELVGDFRRTTIALINKIQSFVNSEYSYWYNTNHRLYKYLNKIGRNGELPG